MTGSTPCGLDPSMSGLDPGTSSSELGTSSLDLGTSSLDPGTSSSDLGNFRFHREILRFGVRRYPIGRLARPLGVYKIFSL
jgi:hypothetical protein